ncbi:hypothetical protein QG37_05718 [Candidozyma auris]|uniref:Uncharacterized protein n=1 Tax=Candidozyma auris TaxID=498019 RepID=A0A0L0NTL0_CANAR|nr:hypothetical protein QG37_05718 [[Candida] auris]
MISIAERKKKKKNQGHSPISSLLIAWTHFAKLQLFAGLVVMQVKIAQW